MKYFGPFVCVAFALLISWLLGCDFDRSPSTAYAILFAIWCGAFASIPWYGEY